MGDRVVILSDLHLGRPRRGHVSADALRPVWEGAAHLVVNGDVAEIHHPTRRAAAARETLRLLDLCEDDGVDLTLLSGNHDPYISDRRHLHLAGGKVFVTHGDVLHPAVAPWSPAGARIRRAHEAAIAALAPEHREQLEARLSASQHASYAEWTHADELEREALHSTVLGMLIRPWALARVLHYWHVFPRLAAAFARTHAPDARFAVLGHTHRPGIWTVDDLLVINTGSFQFPGHPRAVVIDPESVRVERIRRAGDVFRRDARPVARYELPPAPVARPVTRPARPEPPRIAAR